MNVHSTSRNPRNLAESFEIDHVWKLKHIILEILWPKMSWNKLSYANLLYYFFKWKHFYGIVFSDENIDGIKNRSRHLRFAVTTQ